MKITFLGTGASAGLPAAYCRCDECNGVRERGGIEVKTRSALRVGKHCQIDISHDNYWQAIKHSMDMYDVEHLLITHTHCDHFAVTGITDKTMSEVTNDKPLNIYMSEPAKEFMMKFLDTMSVSDEEKKFEREFPIRGLEYYKEYSIGELVVETVKGNHTAWAGIEKSINYLIKMPDGKKLLYALDTGYYLDETWNYLKGRNTDILIMDCTFGGRTDRGEFPDSHLDIESFLKMLERMTEIEFIDNKTDIYASHFNPHQGLTHFEIQDRFNKSSFHVTVAYDGLKVGE